MGAKSQQSKVKGKTIKSIRRDYEQAIKHTDGRLTSIAKYLDIHIQSAWTYLNKYPEINQQAKMRRQILLEKAEQNIEAYVNSPDNDYHYKATEFILKTLGRTVYSEKITQDINVNKLPDLKINFDKE